MPGERTAQLQHSGKFVKKENAAIVGQTGVIKSDPDVSRRSAHPDFNLTESDVKVRKEKVNEKPANIGARRLSTPVFTPDSGHIFCLKRGYLTGYEPNLRSNLVLWRAAFNHPVEVVNIFLKCSHVVLRDLMANELCHPGPGGVNRGSGIEDAKSG